MGPVLALRPPVPPGTSPVGSDSTWSLERRSKVFIVVLILPLLLSPTGPP